MQIKTDRLGELLPTAQPDTSVSGTSESASSKSGSLFSTYDTAGVCPKCSGKQETATIIGGTVVDYCPRCRVSGLPKN